MSKRNRTISPKQNKVNQKKQRAKKQIKTAKKMRQKHDPTKWECKKQMKAQR